MFCSVTICEIIKDLSICEIESMDVPYVLVNVVRVSNPIPAQTVTVSQTEKHVCSAGKFEVRSLATHPMLSFSMPLSLPPSLSL